MKKIILSLMLFFLVVNFITGNNKLSKKLTEKYELITYDFGDFEFQLPKDIELRENKTSEKSVTYNVWFTDLEIYLNQPGYMLNGQINKMKKENICVTMDKIKEMLLIKGYKGSVNAYNLNYCEESWQIIKGNSFLGDSIFGAGDVPTFSSYLITLYLDDGFYFINLSANLFNDIERKYPEIFILQNDLLYWNKKKDNKRTCVKLWKLISSRDANLPEELILLQDAYDIFLETVKFK